MADQIAVGPIHHLGITVSDMERAIQFYTDVLGFQLVAEFGPKRIISNGSVMIGLGPAAGGSGAGDRFDESRVGLDHLSFSVGSRADLEQALAALDARGVPHGEINDLAPFQISILAFRDPDNIQLELTAPYVT
jgi:glyoxylase I family protein